VKHDGRMKASELSVTSAPALIAGGGPALAGGEHDESIELGALDESSVSGALDVLPEDVLEVLVLTMAAQPRKPASLVALTSTCHCLFALRPSRLQQAAARDTVSHSLGTRPSTSELHRQGIIKGSPGMSPTLVKTHEALRRQMTRNSMSQSLERRPTADELHQKGIIKGTASLSSRVAATCETLRSEMRKDAMSHSLGKRPTPTELQDKGIIKGSLGVSPRLVEAREALRKEMAKDVVSHTLGSRPSPQELESKGIYRSRAPSGNCRQGT